jgi:hypothetical protein
MYELSFMVCLALRAEGMQTAVISRDCICAQDLLPAADISIGSKWNALSLRRLVRCRAT